MPCQNEEQINLFIRELDNEKQETRIQAINQLGEIGDELCLKELRERMKYISDEHRALIIAVGKLKRKLGVK